MTANRLGFFNVIADQTLSAEEIASRCGTHPRSTRMLLNAASLLALWKKMVMLIATHLRLRRCWSGVSPNTSAMRLLIRTTSGRYGADYTRQYALISRVGDRYNLVEEPKVHRNFIMAMHDNASELLLHWQRR